MTHWNPGGIIHTQGATDENVLCVEEGAICLGSNRRPGAGKGMYCHAVEDQRGYHHATPQVESPHTWCFEEGRRTYATCQSVGPPDGPSHE